MASVLDRQLSAGATPPRAAWGTPAAPAAPLRSHATTATTTTNNNNNNNNNNKTNNHHIIINDKNSNNNNNNNNNKHHSATPGPAFRGPDRTYKYVG